MNFRDPIRLGNEGRIRVQFIDANNQPIEAQNVSVDLFAPGLNPDTDTPTVSNQTPTYLGNGIFELAVTAIAPEGVWIDVWTGDILGTTTTVQLNFQVIASGSIANYPINGLYENALVEITLLKSISSTTGTSLEEDNVFRFTTTYSPLHSSVRKVQLDAGGILSNVPDDVINLAILEASLEANVLHFRKQIINNNVFLHARRQYVTSTAALTVANNLLASRGLLKSKMLADFKVDYDPSVIANLLQSLQNSASKWLEQLMSGGGARTIRNPKGVVKGELDPDRPTAGRLWNKVGASELPIGNTKFRSTGSRRFRTGWVIKPGGDSDW